MEKTLICLLFNLFHTNIETNLAVPVDTQPKLNIHEAFALRPERDMNGLKMFVLDRVSTSSHLNYFRPMFHFYTPWKSQKTGVFFMVNLFLSNILFLYPLKMSENFWFPDVFREHRNETLTYSGQIGMIITTESITLKYSSRFKWIQCLQLFHWCLLFWLLQ